MRVEVRALGNGFFNINALLREARTLHNQTTWRGDVRRELGFEECS